MKYTLCRARENTYQHKQNKRKKKQYAQTVCSTWALWRFIRHNNNNDNNRISVAPYGRNFRGVIRGDFLANHLASTDN